MSIFVLKIIACLTMVIDHIKYAIPFQEGSIWIYVGRISFPLFAFIASEGYAHTKDLKKYYIRLFIFALISQIPFMLFRTLVGEWKMLNIMFTLILGISAITVYEKIEKKYLSIPLVLIIVILGKFLNVDYSWFGVLLVFVFHISKKRKFAILVSYICLLTLYCNITGMLVKEYILYYVFYLVPIIPILLYNGKKGMSMKYFFYLFYPIHMLIIYMLGK